MYRKSARVLSSLWAIILLSSFAAMAQDVPPQIIGANFEKPSAETAARFSEWQNVGPLGGDVRSLAVDPANEQHFYFGTLDGQIYTSYDGGQRWRLLVNFNRTEMSVDSLMIDARDPKTIYAAGHRHGKNPGGFFKSTDAGATWREIKELKNQAVYALVQSSKNPDMLVIGTLEGVFVSWNSGSDWKKISDSTVVPGMREVESVAVDPRNTDIIYAGTWYRPYKTTDGGKNWRLISKGMIDDSDVFAINIDPRNPEHVIASACSGIYDSTNSGETWKKIQGIPSASRRTRDILQHPSKAGYVYAGTTEGFWMSSDGGVSWSLTTSKQLEINSITVHPTTPEKIYIGTNNYGVMVSNDYGKTFTMTNGGFSTRQTNIIVPDVETPNRFYAVTTNTATGGGFFFVSNDGGATWQASMRNFPRTLIVYSILQDAANPNTIHLGTVDGIYRSIDRGASWAAVTAPKKKAAPRGKSAAARKSAAKPAAAKPAATAAVKPAAKVAVLTEKVSALSPTHDGKNGMLAATVESRGKDSFTSRGVLYRTYDLNQGWERISLPENSDSEILTVAVSPEYSKTIWVGTAKHGVLVSRDGGATWAKDAGVPDNYPIAHIEIDPTNADNVYVGTKLTFYTTKNGGESWDRRGGGLPAGDYTSIIINPNNPEEIFAGSAEPNREGLFRSGNGGKSWERVESEKSTLASRRILALTFDPRNPNRILIGSHSAGIYRIERNLTAAVQE